MEKEIKEEKTFDYTVEQFADLQLLRYVVHGFEDLSLEQKELVYYLSQAALEGRDILFDQNGKYNLVIRRMLETVYTDYQGNRADADFVNLEIYLKRVWFSKWHSSSLCLRQVCSGVYSRIFQNGIEKCRCC